MLAAAGLVIAMLLGPTSSDLAERDNRVPRYAPAQILRHVEGVVIFVPCATRMLDHGRTSRDTELCISRSSGDPALDAAALKAVETWHSNPGLDKVKPAGEDLPVFVPPGCARA